MKNNLKTKGLKRGDIVLPLLIPSSQFVNYSDCLGTKIQQIDLTREKTNLFFIENHNF